MTGYFDTSAVVKLVVDEDGSETAGRLWEATDPVVSALAYAEGRAALARRRRDGDLSARALRAAAAAFDSLLDEVTEVACDSAVARQAGDAAERLAVRGPDAVHLATALVAAPEGLFITWDRRLGEAAEACGFAVAPAT